MTRHYGGSVSFLKENYLKNNPSHSQITTQDEGKKFRQLKKSRDSERSPLTKHPLKKSQDLLQQKQKYKFNRS